MMHNFSGVISNGEPDPSNVRRAVYFHTGAYSFGVDQHKLELEIRRVKRELPEDAALS